MTGRTSSERFGCRRGRVQQADAAGDEGSQPVLVPVPRCGEDDVAHDGQRTAVDDQVVVDRRGVLLEEAGRVNDEPFDADGPGSHDRDRAADIPVDLARGLLVIESVVSPLKVRPRNGASSQSACAVPGTLPTRTPTRARTLRRVRTEDLRIEAEEERRKE